MPAIVSDLQMWASGSQSPPSPPTPVAEVPLTVQRSGERSQERSGDIHRGAVVDVQTAVPTPSPS